MEDERVYRRKYQQSGSNAAAITKSQQLFGMRRMIYSSIPGRTDVRTDGVSAAAAYYGIQSHSDLSLWWLSDCKMVIVNGDDDIAGLALCKLVWKGIKDFQSVVIVVPVFG